MVTGESLPVHNAPGSEVTGATINKNGTLRVRAVKVGADTALAQIVKLVQEAQNSKAPGQRLADRAAFWLVLVALTGGGLSPHPPPRLPPDTGIRVTAPVGPGGPAAGRVARHRSIPPAGRSRQLRQLPLASPAFHRL